VPETLKNASEKLIYAATVPDETGAICTSDVEAWVSEVRACLAAPSGEGEGKL
jgi:hypothetical protein